MKIIVVGSGGRLGGALMRVLGADHSVQGFDRSALDLADPRAIEDALGGIDFDALLTPAAITNVDYCEGNPEEAMLVNAKAPAQMAEIAARKGARLIHFSTDYVFDGRDREPRIELDPVNPLGAYGRSKAAGEEGVLRVSERFFVARVCWLFGPERPSFLDSIIRRAMADEGVAAISDKISTPSYADDVSRMVGQLLELPEAGGLIHLCNTGGCSWQEYGQAALDGALEAGIALKTHTLGAMGLDDIGFDAPRPAFTALSNARFSNLVGKSPRGWREAVSEYVSQFADEIAAGSA